MSFIRRLALIVSIALFSVSAAPAAAHAAAADDEAAFLRDLNALRTSKGLNPLGINLNLTNVARAWSLQMAQRGAIAHNPNMAAQAPSNWTKLGENVGVGGSEAAIHQALVNSPGHYANMVDSKYTEVGIGVVHGNGRVYVTQNFMASTNKAAAPVRPAAAPSTPPVAPAGTPFNQRYAKVKAENKALVDNARSVKANIALGR